AYVELESSDGIFVMYSAASNRTALDRLSPSDPVNYSVFTRVLLPLMGRRDLTIQELGTTVKNQVYGLAQRAGRDQRPTYYDGILGRFCLPGCAEVPPEPDKPPMPPSFTTLPPTMTGQDGAPMVLVPAGEFTMGARDDDKNARDDERPAHPVYLDAFYLDQYEVTTSRYAKFFQATKRDPPQYWSESVLKQHGNKPVVGVTWEDANVYCVWAGKKLPTEAQWEKAARGTAQRLYPWGNEPPTPNLANFDKCCDFKDHGVLTDVGSFEGGKSLYGVYDMAGNVWEWVADLYDANLYQSRAKTKGEAPRNPSGPGKGEFKVLRGGSWLNEAGSLRSSSRFNGSSSDWNDFIGVGFRCAQGAP
ncbi:MAG: formylglycine-generating enzyme family protein, partial [Nitrospirota bacterium]